MTFADKRDGVTVLFTWEELPEDTLFFCVGTYASFAQFCHDVFSLDASQATRQRKAVFFRNERSLIGFSGAQAALVLLHDFRLDDAFSAMQAVHERLQTYAYRPSKWVRESEKIFLGISAPIMSIPL